MKWFSVLKISRKDMIADAKRFAPEDMAEGKRKKAQAYSRFRMREGRNPKKLELREELLNPVYLGRKGRTGRKKGSKNKPKDYYALIRNIILYLEANHKPVTEENVINEMGLNKEPDEEFLKMVRRYIDKLSIEEMSK